MAQQTIKLSYNIQKNTFISDPPTVAMIEGDTVQFVSDQGHVSVKFDPPECFAPVKVAGGIVEVRIVKRAPAKMPCGIMLNGGIIGFPLNEDFGPGSDPAS